jgi:hypothetical protein
MKNISKFFIKLLTYIDSQFACFLKLSLLICFVLDDSVDEVKDFIELGAKDTFVVTVPDML